MIFDMLKFRQYKRRAQAAEAELLEIRGKAMAIRKQFDLHTDVEWLYNDSGEIFTDSKGRKYYQLKDAVLMHYQRAVWSQIILREADMCMTREWLKDQLGKIDQAINRQRTADVIRLIDEIKLRNGLAAEDETLFRLAAVYFIREDEDPRTYDEEFAKAKVQQWRNDKADHDFFLVRSWKLIRESGELSEAAILNYLNEAKHQLQRLAAVTS